MPKPQRGVSHPWAVLISTPSPNLFSAEPLCCFIYGGSDFRVLARRCFHPNNGWLWKVKFLLLLWTVHILWPLLRPPGWGLVDLVSPPIHFLWNLLVSFTAPGWGSQSLSRDSQTETGDRQRVQGSLSFKDCTVCLSL